MSESTYHYHRSRMGEKEKYSQEKSLIKSLFHKHHGCYGYRRITDAMSKNGYRLNHKTVYRLMKEIGIKCRIRATRYRSYHGEIGHTAPNVINRDFRATSPNCKWATDVTQFSISNRKCYLSPILDMFNGEIVSYTLSDVPNLQMVMSMLGKAFRKITTTAGIIMHSDQGWHYQHRAYTDALATHGIIQSMSRKGNCLDNAMMENFFGLLKSEILYNNRYKTMGQFKQALRAYIDYYNIDRIKLRLNGMSPIEYRKLFENNCNLI